MAKDPNYSESFSIFTPEDNKKTYTGEAVKLFYIPVREAVLWDQNPKKHDLNELKRSIEQNGFRDPPTWDNVLQGMIEGNGRTTALREMEKEGRKPPRGIVVHKDEGYWCMPVLFGIDAESQSQAIRYAIDHNNLTLAGAGFTHDDMARMWDKDLYVNVLQNIDDGIMPVSLDGFDLKGFADQDSGDNNEGEIQTGNLFNKFLIPPFTILDARQGYWQDRKKTWISLGIQSETGRDDDLIYKDDLKKKYSPKKDSSSKGMSGTSIFDPVLCEIVYTWFTPKSGKIIDPFAGGSVRGIVAGKLNRHYTGVELRKDQVEANRKQADDIFTNDVKFKPTWVNGDSLQITSLVQDEFDFVFSCPPYYDLEVYSEDENDLSNKSTYAEFIDLYREIISKSVSMLKNNRFACFVVGDLRDSNGNYRNFVSDTINAFIDAGCNFYNEAFLVTSIGSLAIRASKSFPIGRKLGKAHQNVLVFVKGDGKKAAEACGNIEVFVPEYDSDEMGEDIYDGETDE